MKQALTKRNLHYHIPNIPEDVPGRILVSWSTKDYVDRVCSGHKEAGFMVHRELKAYIEEYKATCRYEDLEHS
jgi:hypothetical protein